MALVLLLPLTPCAAEDEPAKSEWYPRSDFDGNWDWLQIKTGEWVKGKIIAMYDKSLEFDSDHFDTLILDWDDVRQIHSSQVVNIGLTGRRSAVGTLILDGKQVTVKNGGVEQQFTRAEVITITAGAPKEINYWSMKAFFGLIIRTGNSDVREVNVQANVKRRTIRNRIVVDSVANQNVTDGETISNNQRASASWDKFISDRFFVQPIYGEYFRDPFQNIDSRYTAGVGAGYELIDTANVDWSVSGGPGYQETRFDQVPAGESEQESTPALIFSTDASWDITQWLEFDGQYGMSLVNEKSGTYTHHLVASFETDITRLIDFDVSWIWDRTKDPQPLSDGTVPEQDDFRTTVGLTFEF